MLLVHDSRTRDRVEAELRKRYGADYQVITTGSVKEALGVLGQLHDDQRQVSLVLADQWLPEATGTDLLARVRQLHPAARRVLLITWGDQASAALDALTGAGVFYGAAASEARAMKDSEVFVVGGANSAGQAAVHLARYAAHVTVLVRGRSLADSMSEYLIREIESAPNIAVRHRVAVTGGAGQSRLEHLTLTDLESGEAGTVAAAALFVLIGAEPRTQWLPDALRRDQSGFVVTGTDLLQGGRPDEEWPLRRLPMFLESSLPGVFAAGDVRHGSVKRVASAVGEGSIAIRLVHDHLRGD